MCRSDNNRSTAIDAIKQGWQKLDEHIPENLKGKEYDSVIAYFLGVMKSIVENGIPLPKCTFNNSCFREKSNGSGKTAKDTIESDVERGLDALFEND